MELNVAIRSLLQNLKEKTDQLKDQLFHSVSTRQITQLEGDRRQNLVDELHTRHRQLQASFKNEGTEPDVIRSSLMAGGVRQGITNPWLVEEPEETRGLGFHEIQQQQKRIIEEQDAGLDALSSILSRQKQMGQEIGNELEEQNACLVFILPVNEEACHSPAVCGQGNGRYTYCQQESTAGWQTRNGTIHSSSFRLFSCWLPEKSSMIWPIW
ncbi:syntaxin-8 isoform X5 [Sceloporus undulatus]|uniref:syntaxin-8 isoform X5 n=1 Tax=Sceloporus undulatus TaxID=8520 RepID=UPI001C4B89A1|nr:syntaxin-8 isoform X5 [Sceloporus undulatus]